MTKTTRIFWVSRHSPLATQKEALERRFPGHTLIIDPKPFDGVDDILARYKSVGADEMVVVAPWTVIRQLTKRGLSPIIANMKQVKSAKEAEVTMGSPAKPRHYRFSHFERCDGFSLISHPLDGEPPRSSLRNPTVLLDASGKTKAVIKRD